jgi:hypothetical protein
MTHRNQNRLVSHRLEFVEVANDLEPRARQGPQNDPGAVIDEETVTIDYFGELG